MRGRYLGLFDTPATRQESWLSLAVISLLFAAMFAILPAGARPLGRVGAFVPVIDAITCTWELIIGGLLFGQAAVFRSRALTVLGSGFVFAALLLIPHALTFPGAFAPKGLIMGGPSTAVWLAILRRLIIPISLILYALLKRADAVSAVRAERAPARIASGVVIALTLAALTTVLVTLGRDLLPPLFFDGRRAHQPNLLALNSAITALTVLAITLIVTQKARSVLDIWLLVALAGWLVHSVVNMPLHGRFTFGWYSLFGLMLFSNFVVMIALLAESSRLHTRLALSVAAQDRELETRLMSMDAVAAIIAHEVVQPLTAVRLSGSAGIDWLNRQPPNTARAIKSLEASMEAGRHAFDAIKKVRAAFGTGAGAPSDFSLNDLVRETSGLLDRDMAAQRISLRLLLDKTLPAIHADRTQIQRVLVNLLTNAIDALAEAPRNNRRIIIRSSTPDSEHVLIEVRDSGLSIAPDQVAKMFEPFFTTKPGESGLGLPLSRNIVEDHGGRLWASAEEDGGLAFHLELPVAPRSRSFAAAPESQA